MQRYTTAALPPHCSPEACLALSNLLTGGITSTPSSPLIPNVTIASHPEANETTRPSDTRTGSTHVKADFITTSLSNFFSIFQASKPPSPRSETPGSQPEVRFDFIGNNWAMRKEGKRAVRDVQLMGIAGGWLVLGLGWIVDKDLGSSSQPSGLHGDNVRPKVTIVYSSPHSPYEPPEQISDEPLMMSSTFKARANAFPRRADADTPSSESKSATEPATTVDSDLRPAPSPTKSPSEGEDDLELLRLLYDLLQPLVNLYRHGHIQASDPVFLPPITPRQLPSVLRPAGDLQKGRNAWALGGVVAAKLLSMPALRPIPKSSQAVIPPNGTAILDERQQLAAGVRNIANYIVRTTPLTSRGCDLTCSWA